MLGLYAEPLLALMTEEERNSPFWDLAVRYLSMLANQAAAHKQDPVPLRKRLKR
jgi:hypothetical protein